MCVSLNTNTARTADNFGSIITSLISVDCYSSSEKQRTVGSQCVFCAEEEVMVRSGAQMTRGLCGTESLKLIPRLHGRVLRLTLAPLWKPNVIGIDVPN
ncbi:hypothetical protein DPX16_18532 [Anabarilius grahami]|uniref:Uncharacterized protein n=1 Tax=Anabarilius grahami TaxID=495550 RepID=A0A3N0YZ98_ANAGA|nr:hypothetical protein DPX16_18532 [Anabarilius grahami]